MTTIDTAGIRGFMRKARKPMPTDLDEAQAKRVLNGVGAALLEADLGPTPAPQDPDLYGGRSTKSVEPGQIIAAAHADLTDFAQGMDDRHSRLTAEIEHMTELRDRARCDAEKFMQETDDRIAKLTQEAADVAAMRDGARSLLPEKQRELYT